MIGSCFCAALYLAVALTHCGFIVVGSLSATAPGHDVVRRLREGRAKGVPRGSGWQAADVPPA